MKYDNKAQYYGSGANCDYIYKLQRNLISNDYSLSYIAVKEKFNAVALTSNCQIILVIYIRILNYYDYQHEKRIKFV